MVSSPTARSSALLVMARTGILFVFWRGVEGEEEQICCGKWGSPRARAWHVQCVIITLSLGVFPPGPH